MVKMMKKLILLLIVLLTACRSAETAELPVFEPTEFPPTPSPTEALPAAEQWWNDTVFYEVFVRSFYDSDGDGVGDISGLIEKLDYLNDGDPNTDDDLGITGIWLMPITESPSYHGYDVVDYYSIDQEYGTIEEFQLLIDQAHQRGIRVIVDLVLNHTSDQHFWFTEAKEKESVYRDWYLWEIEKPSYRGPWGQDVWHKMRDEYYYGIFWRGMPDLNLQNPEVTEELFNITRFWLEEMQVDGFRLDAIKHLVENGQVQENTKETHAWLERFYTFYKEVDPNAFAVGEAWAVTSQVLDYTGDEVDIAFAFDLAEAILKTARGPLAIPVIKEMTEVVESFPAGQYGIFLANHDQNRVMSQLRGDVIQAKIASTILLTSPGVPFIYYGEELGMSGVKPDEDIRRPMQWNGLNISAGMSTGKPWRLPAIDYNEKNLANQVDDPESLFNHYRKLINMRNEHQALRTGEWTLIDTGSHKLYAYMRHTEEGVFIILVNVHPSDMSGDQYQLTLESGPLSGAVSAISLLGLGNPSPPEINDKGGFSNYVPFEKLPSQSFAVIQLIP
jgi:glycosidase